MKILLIPNMDKVSTKKSVGKIIRILNEDGYSVFLDEKYTSIFLNTKANFIKEDEFYKEVDFVITVGGDGTLLQAAKKAAPHNTSVLGINAGRLGFLTTLEIEEHHLLENLLHEDMEIEKRMLININVKNNDKIVFTADALNEVVIKSKKSPELLETQIFCDGRFVNDYRSDGMIFSTPTGSTAYNMSAGGPIISPNVDSIAVTPIAPHSLFSRTIIFPPDSQISVKLPRITQSNILQKAEIDIDGHSDFTVTTKNEIIITKSKIYAKTVNLKKRKFFDVLNLKILGRG